MPDNTDLKSQYAAQVAEDLERNARERERLGAEIDALQDQLRALDHDRDLLTNMRRTLAGGDGQETTATAPVPVTVPAARKPEESGRTTSRGRKKPAPAAGSRAGKASPAKKAASARKTAPSGAPTLRALVSGHLSGHGEPRSAAEVATALAEAHPGRKVSTTVVRNTLEALVAKGEVQRSRQQKSVFYSASGARQDKAPGEAPGERTADAGPSDPS